MKILKNYWWILAGIVMIVAYVAIIEYGLYFM